MHVIHDTPSHHPQTHTHTNTIHSAQLDSLSEPSSDVPTVNKDPDKLEEKTKAMEMAPLDPKAEQNVTNWKKTIAHALMYIDAIVFLNDGREWNCGSQNLQKKHSL